MPPQTQIDLPKLSALVRTKRADKGLRATAGEIGGVSASTLSRIEQGNVPDLDTFMRICRWLGVEPSEFIAADGKGRMVLASAEAASETPEVIEAHLRADRVLPPETIDALSQMVRLAYKAVNEGKLGKPKK